MSEADIEVALNKAAQARLMAQQMLKSPEAEKLMQAFVLLGASREGYDGHRDKAQEQVRLATNLLNPDMLKVAGAKQRTEALQRNNAAFARTWPGRTGNSSTATSLRIISSSEHAISSKTLPASQPRTTRRMCSNMPRCAYGDWTRSRMPIGKLRLLSKPCGEKRPMTDGSVHPLAAAEPIYDGHGVKAFNHRGCLQYPQSEHPE